MKQKVEIKKPHLAEDSHLAAQKLHRLRCEPGLAAASHACLLFIEWIALFEWIEWIALFEWIEWIALFEWIAFFELIEWIVLFEWIEWIANANNAG